MSLKAAMNSLRHRTSRTKFLGATLNFSTMALVETTSASHKLTLTISVTSLPGFGLVLMWNRPRQGGRFSTKAVNNINSRLNSIFPEKMKSQPL